MHGFKNVTFIYGTEGFTDELFDAILAQKVRRVRIAYDADDAGNRAAARDTERLTAHGIEVLPRQVPLGHGRQRVRPEGHAGGQVVADALERRGVDRRRGGAPSASQATRSTGRIGYAGGRARSLARARARVFFFSLAAQLAAA